MTGHSDLLLEAFLVTETSVICEKRAKTFLIALLRRIGEGDKLSTSKLERRVRTRQR